MQALLCNMRFVLGILAVLLVSITDARAQLDVRYHRVEDAAPPHSLLRITSVDGEPLPDTLDHGIYLDSDSAFTVDDGCRRRRGNYGGFMFQHDALRVAETVPMPERADCELGGELQRIQAAYDALLDQYAEFSVTRTNDVRMRGVQSSKTPDGVHWSRVGPEIVLTRSSPKNSEVPPQGRMRLRTATGLTPFPPFASDAWVEFRYNQIVGFDGCAFSDRPLTRSIDGWQVGPDRLSAEVDCEDTSVRHAAREAIERLTAGARERTAGALIVEDRFGFSEFTRDETERNVQPSAFPPGHSWTRRGDEADDLEALRISDKGIANWDGKGCNFQDFAIVQDGRRVAFVSTPQPPEFSLWDLGANCPDAAPLPDALSETLRLSEDGQTLTRWNSDTREWTVFLTREPMQGLDTLWGRKLTLVEATGLSDEQLSNPRPHGPPRPVTLTLHTNRMQAFDGCNRGTGNIVMAGGRLHLRGWGQTVAGCGKSREPLSDALFRVFDDDARYTVTNDELRVESADGVSVFRDLSAD